MRKKNKILVRTIPKTAGSKAGAHDADSGQMPLPPELLAWIENAIQGGRLSSDLIAEVTMRVLKRLFSPPPIHNISAYIRTTLNNLLRDGYRKKSPKVGWFEESPEDDGEGCREPKDPDASTPSAIAACEELCSTLHAVIRDLGAHHREVIYLRFFAGLKNREIARILKLKSGTVAVRVNRALKAVRRQLENNAILPEGWLGDGEGTLFDHLYI